MSPLRGSPKIGLIILLEPSEWCIDLLIVSKTEFIEWVFPHATLKFFPYALGASPNRARLFASTAFSKSTVLKIKKEKGFYNLGRYLDLYEDKSSKLTIQEIGSKKWSSKFRRSKENAPNFGGASSAFWARLTIKNEMDLKKDWFISFNFYTHNFLLIQNDCSA